MSIIPQLSWVFYDVCDFVCNQLAAIARRQKILQDYFTSLLRLLYGCRMNTILKKKIARLRKAAARPPYEIVKPLGNHIVADQFLDMSTFGPQNSRKADPRRFLMLTALVDLSID